jgi:hypothetical protein
VTVSVAVSVTVSAGLLDVSTTVVGTTSVEMLTAVEVVVETLFVVVVWVTVSFFGPEATMIATATPSPSARA